VRNDRKRAQTFDPAIQASAAAETAGPPAGADALDKVILLVVSGLSAAAITTACTAKLQLQADQVPALIAEAQRRIVLAAAFDRTREIGTAITRLTDLYNRCLRVQDVKTALGAQREINHLLDLYRTETPAAVDSDQAFSMPEDPWSPPPTTTKRKRARR
jgi:hypothetical protein